MRCTTKYVCLLAATATGVLIPDAATAEQLRLEAQIPPVKRAPRWVDVLQLPEIPEDLKPKPKRRAGFAGIDVLGSLFGEYDFQYLSVPDCEEGTICKKCPVLRPTWLQSTLSRTAYETIQGSEHTRHFAALVNGFPDIVELLNSTNGPDLTVFVPSDSAFEKLAMSDFPDNDGKAPRPFVEALVKHHIVIGNYSLAQATYEYTLPTIFYPNTLGWRPQRLSVGRGAVLPVMINGRMVVVGDMFTQNAAIHGINGLIVPEPTARDLIFLMSQKKVPFTFEEAALKTGLFTPELCSFTSFLNGKEGGGCKEGDAAGADVKKIFDGTLHHHSLNNRTGLTIFLPSNHAFQRLGLRANAFLFNTKKGLPYLDALLRYHVVVNETLYMDAYYGPQQQTEAERRGGGVMFDIFMPPKNKNSSTATMDKNGKAKVPSIAQTIVAGDFHVEMPTLMKGRALAVDLYRLHSHIGMRVNSRVTVDPVRNNLVAGDGVVHMVPSVLVPPPLDRDRDVDGDKGQYSGVHRRTYWSSEDGEISVEELVERLEPYINHDGDDR